LFRAVSIRTALAGDADGIAAIYAPIVRDTAISFELNPPDGAEMRSRILECLKRLPWLVSIDETGKVNGYAYASRHRERHAYRWSVDATVYVRHDSRSRGVAGRLYGALFDELVKLGYFQVFAGITLPNQASTALHQSVGFELVGVYRNVGFKHGIWHDVSWWQKPLQPPMIPREPSAFGKG
jgi:L-amino acid N-acyltransferase YncA